MHNHIHTVHKSSGGMVYSVGMIGAAFYYLQHATSFQNALVGIFKALFWPAFFVYKAIELWQF